MYCTPPSGWCDCIGKGRRAEKSGKNKSKWTHEERKVLWECFVSSGGKKTGGYLVHVYQEGEVFGTRKVARVCS